MLYFEKLEKSRDLHEGPASGSEEAANALLKQGCKRTGFITPRRNKQSGRTEDQGKSKQVCKEEKSA